MLSKSHLSNINKPRCGWRGFIMYIKTLLLLFHLGSFEGLGSLYKEWEWRINMYFLLWITVSQKGRTDGWLSLFACSAYIHRGKKMTVSGNVAESMVKFEPFLTPTQIAFSSSLFLPSSRIPVSYLYYYQSPTLTIRKIGGIRHLTWTKGSIL